MLQAFLGETEGFTRTLLRLTELNKHDVRTRHESVATQE